MHKKFEINQIKGGCQSVRKVVAHDSKSDLPLTYVANLAIDFVQYFFFNSLLSHLIK